MSKPKFVFAVAGAAAAAALLAYTNRQRLLNGIDELRDRGRQGRDPFGLDDEDFWTEAQHREADNELDFDLKYATDEALVTSSDLTVALTSVGPNRISVIRTVRELTGFDLAQAQGLVAQVENGAPVPVIEGVSFSRARTVALALANQGAEISLKASRPAPRSPTSSRRTPAAKKARDAE